MSAGGLRPRWRHTVVWREGPPAEDGPAALAATRGASPPRAVSAGLADLERDARPQLGRELLGGRADPRLHVDPQTVVLEARRDVEERRQREQVLLDPRLWLRVPVEDDP